MPLELAGLKLKVTHNQELCLDIKILFGFYSCYAANIPKYFVSLTAKHSG